MLPSRAPFSRIAACLLAGGLAWASPGQTAEPAATVPAGDRGASTDALVAPDAAWWRDGVARFGSLWDGARARLADGSPDWLHHFSRQSAAFALPSAPAAYVVVRDDHADGMGQVTVRYPLAVQGALRAYAGAGLNHTQYFVDGPDANSSLQSRQNHRGAVDPAAELGAEIALTERMKLGAELRWVDLDERPGLLSGIYGPLAPDPVTVGISLGYRFR